MSPTIMTAPEVGPAYIQQQAAVAQGEMASSVTEQPPPYAGLHQTQNHSFTAPEATPSVVHINLPVTIVGNNNIIINNIDPSRVMSYSLSCLLQVRRNTELALAAQGRDSASSQPSTASQALGMSQSEAPVLDIRTNAQLLVRGDGNQIVSGPQGYVIPRPSGPQCGTAFANATTAAARSANPQSSDAPSQQHSTLTTQTSTAIMEPSTAEEQRSLPETQPKNRAREIMKEAQAAVAAAQLSDTAFPDRVATRASTRKRAAEQEPDNAPPAKRHEEAPSPSRIKSPK
jgi:hypothetical protein